MGTLKHCTTCGCVLLDDPTLEWPSDYDREWFKEHPGEVEYNRLAMPREHPWCQKRFSYVITIKKITDKIRIRSVKNVNGTYNQRKTTDA